MRKTLIGILILIALQASAQEVQQSAWHVTPAIALTKYFPGSSLRGENGYYGGDPVLWGFAPGPGRDFRYAGTGLNFAVRAFNDEHPNLALTFGAGITWYYDAERPSSGTFPMAALSGIGAQIGNADFTAFPISLGIQAVYPYEGRENFMLFGGFEGNLHLISGNVPMGEQAKLGFGLTGGFAVKIFEFGVRYTTFSDMRNLGAYLGFRLNSFSL